MTKNNKYNKEISFGKIAYFSTIKRNEVVLDLNLEVDNNKIKFSASGNVWNHIHSDILMGGQCIDSIWNDYSGEIENPTLYKEIMTLWQKWHLNDMNPGCKHQRALGWGDILLDESKPKTQDNMATWTHPKRKPLELAAYRLYNAIPWKYRSLKKWVRDTFHVDVWRDESKAHEKGVLGKPCPKCGYKYGTAWVYEPIDQKDLRRIMTIMDIDPQVMSSILKINKS